MIASCIRPPVLSIVLRNSKHLSTSIKCQVKVTVLGASGGIGQPLSLLLKESPLITALSLYDIASYTLGVAADVSHIETKAKVTGYLGQEQLKNSLKDAQVVNICAGEPQKPGMTREDLFEMNASVIRDLATAIGEVSPKALIAIMTNPINSVVPIAAEVLRRAGVYDPKKLFGITTLDIVRANKFIADALGLDPKAVNVPVVGGHSLVTIVPLLSQCTPALSLSQADIEALTVKIQVAGTEVLKAKAGAGSATLSMAYAGARFTFALCRALNGEPNIVECSYVQSDVTEAKYFSTPVLLGPNGIEMNLGLGKLSDYENQLLKVAIPELKKNIQKGEDFVIKE